jgi:flagellin
MWHKGIPPSIQRGLYVPPNPCSNDSRPSRKKRSSCPACRRYPELGWVATKGRALPPIFNVAHRKTDASTEPRMLSIISNINSLVAQENLNGSGIALSQAIARLSSGKRINSAADDAAGLAVSTTLQSTINGLNQGVSNANDAVSMVQTASQGLSALTQSLQTIRQLAVEAGDGSLSASNQAALQQQVTQQIAEVNRIASQTTYNGINLLDGSAGLVNVQVGSKAGQTVSLNLSQDLSAASLGVAAAGPTYTQAGTTLGTMQGLDLTSTGAENTSGGPGAITQINVLADGYGGFTFTDQNNQALSRVATNNLFATTPGAGVLTLSLSTSASNGLSLANEQSAIYTAATSGALGTLGVISGISLSPTTGNPVAAGTANAITSLTVVSTGTGLTYFDQNDDPVLGLGPVMQAVTQDTPLGTSTFGSTGTGVQPPGTTLAGVNSNNVVVNNAATANNGPTTVAAINVSTAAGANFAMQTIDDALATVDNMQASLGAVQNRFASIVSAQQDQSTDLSMAQSQITDADFAKETANLSKAQVLQQAGISVLAQANSQAQNVLKLLQ